MMVLMELRRQRGVKAWELNCEKLLFEQRAEEPLKMAQEKTVKIVALHCQRGVKAWEMLTQNRFTGTLRSNATSFFSRFRPNKINWHVFAARFHHSFKMHTTDAFIVPLGQHKSFLSYTYLPITQKFKIDLLLLFILDVYIRKCVKTYP